MLVKTALLVTLAAAVLPAAQPQLEIVHSEIVPLGTSTMTASFSDWPISAGKALDFVFEPARGINGRSATLRAISPSGRPRPIGWLNAESEVLRLARHPRARHGWGLDVVSLPEEGLWHFQFRVKGPEGVSTGVLPIRVGPRPGPPAALSWVVGMLPWATIAPFLVYGWVRGRRTRIEDARAWSG